MVGVRGFCELKMLSVLKFGILALITLSIASAVRSTNLVVRRQNQNTSKPPLTDLFSNSQCSSSSCPSRSTCSAGGTCCMCQCLYDYPNVLVNTTHFRCTNYDETNRITAANCHFSFGKANKPLEVLPLTKIANGKIKFSNESHRVNCSENEVLSVEKWQFLDVNGTWKNGEGDVFSTDFKTVGGRNGNKKDLAFVKWAATVDDRYAGLIIKLSLTCAGADVGCILAKINGTHEFSMTSVPSEHTTVRTSEQPSTDYSSSSMLPQSSSTGRPSTVRSGTSTVTSGPSTVRSGPSTVTPGVSTVTPGVSTVTPGVSTVTPGVTIVPGTGVSTVGQPTSNSPAKQQAIDETTGTGKKKGLSSGAVAGAVGGVLSLIGLVCLIMVLYRRRKGSISERIEKLTDIESEVTLENYQDPVYAELPDQTKNAGDFDNPVYCDPNDEQIMKRKSKLGPLPALPEAESTYQSLDQTTRNDAGPNFSASPVESSEYLNPDRAGSPSDNTDYDNPPKNIESSDYDNPSVQDTSNPPMVNEHHENFDSADYDNPVGENHDIPRENEPSQDVVTEPVYFVLEQENSSC